MLYSFLNIFFFIFHTTLILFNLFGWIWKKTRIFNLATLGGTLLSWTVLGIWYGFGFCPCTQWHWLVRMKLGYRDMADSYIKFLVDSLVGGDVNARLVDIAAVLSLLFALGASIFTNVREWRKRIGE